MATKTQTKPVVKPVVANPAPAQDSTSTPATTKPKAEKKQRFAAAKYSPAQVITFNPEKYKAKRGKSLTRFDAFKGAVGSGMTVQQYIDLYKANGWNSTLAHADLRWDAHRNFISVK
jgi:hypothetical protein